ncbi:MAG TPA: methyltransferase domain-containing protein [Vicinamibacteria bacterium]|nr:methyltransferase domain-containing protein [Vicinamibacteria bacterium]
MREQRWDPETYARHGRFVSLLGAGVVELLAPRRGERVLDLGCGDGALTETLAAAGCQVVAVDASEEQVRAARRRGLDARVARGEDLPFVAEFDAVFSNAALHWMRDADAVVASVARALRPGGRFVAEMGGAGNVAAIRSALVEALRRRGQEGDALDTLFLPTADEYRRRLEGSGFEVASIVLFDRPTPLPGELAAWLETFAQPFLHAVGASERPALVHEVTEALRPRLFEPGRGWIADYVRLRFAARWPRGEG